jgi:ABC-type multidrug transport system ATPase subunit
MRLAFEEVTAGYRRGLRRRPVLHAISAEIRPGEVSAIVGPNGAGKTTMLRLASGMLRPWRGRVVRPSGSASTTGAESDGRRKAERGHPVGYLPDHVELPRGQTLARFLRYGAFLAGLSRARAETAVAAAADDVRLRDALQQPLASLSRGKARRAALAFVLMRRPPVLLLDEPWSGLDPAARALLRDVIRAEADRGTLVLVSTHELSELQRVADRLLVLEHGRLVVDLDGPIDARFVEQHLSAS